MKMNYKIISIINIIFILLTFSLVNNKKLNKTIHNIAPITICIDPGHGGKDGGAIYDGYVEKDINLDYLAQAVYKVLGQKDNLLAELIFVSAEEIRELNKTTRGIDKVTDVLSYPTLDGACAAVP